MSSNHSATNTDGESRPSTHPDSPTEPHVGCIIAVKFGFFTGGLYQTMMEHSRWYKRIVRDSKYNDSKRKRPTDGDTYITTKDLIVLQNKQQNKCFWCGIFMNWLERRSNKDGLTLERLNNRVPHLRENCVLACKSCNSKRYDKESRLLIKYFYKWYRRVFDVKVKCDGARRPSFVV